MKLAKALFILTFSLLLVSCNQGGGGDTSPSPTDGASPTDGTSPGAGATSPDAGTSPEASPEASPQ